MDRSAFVRHYREVLGFVSRLVADREVAADLTQESFARTWAAQQAGRPVRNVRAFLYRTARNLVIDTHRRTGVRSAAGPDEDEAPTLDPDLYAGARSLEPEVIVSSRRGLAEVMGVIEALPPRCREAFVLYRFEGLSYAQIATRMGISVRTVEMQLQIAMKACWASLAHEEMRRPSTSPGRLGPDEVAS